MAEEEQDQQQIIKSPGTKAKDLTMGDILLITRAWNFAAQRHAHQKRKGEAKEPYINHLAEVAELVATATEGMDSNLVAAAVHLKVVCCG